MDLEALIHAYGYIGLAVAVFLTNVTLFVGIPTPTYVLLAVALGLDPLAVTLVSGVASALGETTGYILGYGGKKVLEKKYAKELARWSELFHKYGFWAVVFIAALPFPPDDVAGVLAGSVGYDYRKFLLATFIGKSLKYGAVAFGTSFGMALIG